MSLMNVNLGFPLTFSNISEVTGSYPTGVTSPGNLGGEMADVSRYKLNMPSSLFFFCLCYFYQEHCGGSYQNAAAKMSLETARVFWD